MEAFLALSNDQQKQVFEVVKKVVIDEIEANIPDTFEVACHLWNKRFEHCNWLLNCVIKHFGVYWCSSPDTVMPWEGKPFQIDAPFCGLTWIIENGPVVFETLYNWFLHYGNREIELPKEFKLQNVYYSTVKTRIVNIVKKLDSSLTDNQIGVLVVFEEDNEAKTPLASPVIQMYPKKTVPAQLTSKVSARCNTFLENLKDFNRFKSDLIITPEKEKVEIPVEYKPKAPFSAEGAAIVNEVLIKFLKLNHQDGEKLAGMIANTFAKALCV